MRTSFIHTPFGGTVTTVAALVVLWSMFGLFVADATVVAWTHMCEFQQEAINLFIPEGNDELCLDCSIFTRPLFNVALWAAILVVILTIVPYNMYRGLGGSCRVS